MLSKNIKMLSKNVREGSFYVSVLGYMQFDILEIMDFIVDFDIFEVVSDVLSFAGDASGCAATVLKLTGQEELVQPLGKCI